VLNIKLSDYKEGEQSLLFAASLFDCLKISQVTDIKKLLNLISEVNKNRKEPMIIKTVLSNLVQDELMFYLLGKLD
jgi:hypothetical protein